MVTIKRNKHCVIVYDEDDGRGITFPTKTDTNVPLYIQELQKLAEHITPGIVLVPLVYDIQYRENSRPLQIFLEGNSLDDLLHNDVTAVNLYYFYFAHAIPQISPEGVSYIFHM